MLVSCAAVFTSGTGFSLNKHTLPVWCPVSNSNHRYPEDESESVLDSVSVVDVFFYCLRRSHVFKSTPLDLRVYL